MKNMKIIKVVIFAALLTLLASCTNAGSIWAKRDPGKKNLFEDDTARHIGDILTIQIAEDSKIDNKSKRDLKKTTDRSITFDGELGIGTKNTSLIARMPGITMKAKSSNELTGKADYKDERSFRDRITVVVIDIHPNGNLVVLGSRVRDIAGDTQIIEVSGIVRPSDIAFDNSIKSEQVANFNIVTKSKGYSKDYNDPGWLGSIFDTLWPF